MSLVRLDGLCAAEVAVCVCVGVTLDNRVRKSVGNEPDSAQLP